MGVHVFTGQRFWSRERLFEQDEFYLTMTPPQLSSKKNSGKKLSRTLGQPKHPNSDVSTFKNFRIRVFQLSTSRNHQISKNYSQARRYPIQFLLKSLIWANFKISMELTCNGYPCFNTFLGHQCSLNTLIRAFHHLKTSELGCFSCSNMLEMDLQEFIFKPIYLVSYYLFYLVYFLLISLLNISVIYEQKPPNLQKLLYRPCVSLFKQG